MAKGNKNPPIEKQKYSPIQIGGTANPTHIKIKTTRASLSLILKPSKSRCPAPNIISKIITDIIDKLTDIKKSTFTPSM